MQENEKRNDSKTLLTVKQNEVSYCLGVSDSTGNDV